MRAILYIHGKGGNATECDRYKPLFPDCFVCGLDYKSNTPWDAGAEIFAAVKELRSEYETVTLIANSIGAYFSLNADVCPLIDRAYFISPVVDMEALISALLNQIGANEAELKEKGVIHTDFGKDLSWEYLRYVREHPIKWTTPTFVLYGDADNLVSFDTICAFVAEHSADLKIMHGGEHWFHTEKQLDFLNEWIRQSEYGDKTTTPKEGE